MYCNINILMSPTKVAVLIVAGQIRCLSGLARGCVLTLFYGSVAKIPQAAQATTLLLHHRAVA